MRVWIVERSAKAALQPYWAVPPQVSMCPPRAQTLFARCTTDRPTPLPQRSRTEVFTWRRFPHAAESAARVFHFLKAKAATFEWKEPSDCAWRNSRSTVSSAERRSWWTWLSCKARRCPCICCANIWLPAASTTMRTQCPLYNNGFVCHFHLAVVDPCAMDKLLKFAVLLNTNFPPTIYM